MGALTAAALAARRGRRIEQGYGERLDMDRIPPAIPDACARVAPDGGSAFNEAICTTDAFLKRGRASRYAGGHMIRIGIAAKGAG